MKCHSTGNRKAFHRSLSLSPIQYMSEESSTSPSLIQDMTQEKEGQEEEAQNLQEQQREEQIQEEHEGEHTTSADKTVSLDRSTPPTSQEEKNQEEHEGEHTTSDEKTVSLDRSTPLTSQEEKNQEEEKVGIIDYHDSYSQGKEKKMKTEPTPGPFLERVFTDIDCEIGLLNSLIDYYETNKKYPFFDYIAADDFIQNWLEISDVSFSQMAGAILRLRKKFIMIVVQIGLNNISDSRDREAFNLAHNIWSNVTEQDLKNLESVCHSST